MKKALFTISAITLFSLANAQSVKTENWPNGNKKSEGVILGTAVIPPGSSKEEMSRQLNNTAKDGKWTTWYESGKLRSEENYDKGTLTGVSKSWYENGQLESDINFTAGTAVYYYDNGKINSQGGITTAMIHTGKWKGFFQDGTINFEGAYAADGQKDGLWIWYNEKGVKTTEQIFKNGALVSSKDF